MTATDLLYQLRGAGIAVSADGDKLRLRAKRGALTDALRAEIQAAKFELIRLLQSDPHEPGELAVPDTRFEASRTDLLDAGRWPPEYTQPATCSGCGPVVLKPGAPNKVAFCPWCFRRRAGKPVPRSPADPFKATVSKHAP